MQTITVKLAGREFLVEEKPSRTNAEIRARWTRQFLTAETVPAMLLEYAPQLAEALADPACYDSDVWVAFREVYALADPFGLVPPEPPMAVPPETAPN